MPLTTTPRLSGYQLSVGMLPRAGAVTHGNHGVCTAPRSVRTSSFGRPRGLSDLLPGSLFRRQPQPQPQQQQQQGAVTCASKKDKPKLVYNGPPYAVDPASDGISVNKASWTAMEGTLQPPAITHGDDYFADKGLEFVRVGEGIDVAELNELFEKVGFPRRDPAKLTIALKHTHRLLWVRCTRGSRFAKEGQLLGFARATGDGVLSATIWDVAVHPAWQRIGLGRALMERLTAMLVEDGLSNIALYAEPGVVGLYERLGFVQDPGGVRGMGFQRKALQAARPQVAAVA